MTEDIRNTRNAPPPPSHQGETFDPSVFTPDEVDAIIGACSTRSASGIRLRALIAVMFGAGLRLAEALALRPSDVRPDERLVFVRNGKGGRARTVALDPDSCELIRRWIDRRPALGLTGRHPLFALYTTGKVGQPMSQRYVRAALLRAAGRAGIDKRVHPHAFRHSAAVDMVRNGATMPEVQRQLGHATLAVTSRYLDHVDHDALQAAAARRAGWRQGGRTEADR